VGIVILLFSGGVILAVVKQTATKVDEGLQVQLCRISNEIKFGLESTTKGIVSGPQVCSTIDKHTKKTSQVPTKKYSQNKEGAEAETRDMIKNCWNMWLDGSEPNMFKKYPFTEGCKACYSYKIKDVAKGVTFASLSKSMEEPLFVEEISDECSPRGGFWKEECKEDEKEFESTIIPPSIENKCCIKKNILNECENKGGICSSEGRPPGYPRIYNDWSCGKRKENCYVKEENLYSYTRYIREFGANGGDVMFIPPQSFQEQTDDFSLIPGEIYAVSFVSPNGRFCTKEEDGAGCWLAIGSYAIIPIAVGAGIYFAPVAAAAVSSTLLKGALSGARSLVLLPVKHPVKTLKVGSIATVGAIYSGINIPKFLSNLATKPVREDAPNFVLVSSLEHAQELGCTLNYGR